MARLSEKPLRPVLPAERMHAFIWPTLIAARFNFAFLVRDSLMHFPCPSCKQAISANPPKPGKYTPKCPKCGKSFVLLVPEDPTATVQVRAASPASGRISAPPKAPPPPSPEITGEFTQQPEEDSNAGGGTEATGGYISKDEPRESTNVEATGEFTSNEGSDSRNEATEATGGYISRDDPGEVDRTAALPSASGANVGTDGTTDHGDVKAPAKSSKKKKAEVEQIEMPEELGGYELVKQLGAGGMGAVYLARQMSLDRAVALKVMHANWAKDPVFLARFTREAYAAAQLNHHNVVQIYDIGNQSGINFFSMEFVDGKSLGDLLKKTGKLETTASVGYIIQAARGLKFAHDRGMIHRDVKPDNLMLNVEGIVKVADLGLIKTRNMTAADDQVPLESPSVSTGGSKLQSVSVDMTNVGTAMGSPSYMAPEQCRDASSVDLRADIYSLGCTLYAMLCGRAPFQGKTAYEVINKHLNEPPPPLRTVAREVPKELADVVDKTLAKDPSDRYQTMEEFIEALKNWQEKSKAGPPRPTEEQIAMFEGLTEQYAAAPFSKLASSLGVVFPLLGILAGLGLMFVKPEFGGAVFVATLTSVLVGFFAGGSYGDSLVFLKVRQWMFGARFIDWVMIAIGILLFLIGIVLLGAILPTALGVVAGTVLGYGYGFFLCRPAASKNAVAKKDFESILKRLRLAGMDEDAVRGFVVTVAGEEWPGVFELLYGYPAMAQHRATLATDEKPVKLSRRDKLLARLDAVIDAREKAKSHKHLQKLERKRLEAEGVSSSEAKAQSQDAADDIVEQAAEIKAANADGKKKVNVREMMTRYERAKLTQIKRKRAPLPVLLFNRVMRTIFDPRLRLVAGALLIIGGLMWAYQNKQELQQAADATDKVGAADNNKQAKKQAVDLLEVFEASESKTKPLQISFLPSEVTSIFDSVNPIAAGVLLILSAFASSTIAIILALLGALISLVGHKLGIPIPDVDPLRANHIVIIVGLLVGIIGFGVFRGR